MRVTIVNEEVSFVKVTHNELLFPEQLHRNSILHQFSPRTAFQIMAVFKQGMTNPTAAGASAAKLLLYYLSTGLPRYHFTLRSPPSKRRWLLQALVTIMPRSKTNKSSFRPRTNPFAETPPHPIPEGIRSRPAPIVIDIAEDIPGRAVSSDWG